MKKTAECLEALRRKNWKIRTAGKLEVEVDPEAPHPFIQSGGMGENVFGKGFTG